MKNKGIPVLMYHSLSGEPTLTAKRKSVSVPLAAFKEQMGWLYKEGYKTLACETKGAYTSAEGQADKYFILTFDDGYYSWHRHAQEILASYGFTATMFLSTAYVNGSYDNTEGFHHIKDDRPLTWKEVRELSDNGWSVQAHGHHHYKWTSIPLACLAKELRICKSEIEQGVGKPVRRIAYPFGDYSLQILNYLSNAGYHEAYTVHTGMLSPTADRFRLPRIEVNNMDTLESFQRKIETGHASATQAIRAKMRDLIYANAAIKDLLNKVVK
jgi:peptidoglycan/xylan/chitin deacetylase (PgdA/CDA1 family)